MILKALTLENFKGIREPVRIEFAPLTLLFGPNNAGKSTIVQALTYARESWSGTTSMWGGPNSAACINSCKSIRILRRSVYNVMRIRHPKETPNKPCRFLYRLKN
jgi:ABC-type hemin transport system ATPase subunit